MEEMTAPLHLLLIVPALLSARAAGQALVAWLVGYRVTSFGVGTGRIWYRRPIGRSTMLYLSPWLLTGARCGIAPVDRLDPGRRAAAITGGGLLAMLSLFGGLVLLGADTAGLVALLVLALCTLPWRLGGVASDGWLLMTSLGIDRIGAWPGAARRAMMERFSAIEAGVGSPLGSAYGRLVLAWMDLQLGRSPSLPLAPPADPRLQPLHEYVIANWHLVARRPLAALRTIRDAWEREEGRHNSLLHNNLLHSGLLHIAEARTWLRLDEPAAAHRALSALVGVRGVLAREATVLRLELALAWGSVREINALAQRVGEIVGAGVLEPVNAVGVLRRAAEVLHEAGRQASSLSVQGSAARLTRALLASAAPVDRLDLAAALEERGLIRA